MSGMGDAIKQRALVRYWMTRRQVWLQTCWPQLYYDLVGPLLRLVPNKTVLRTQRKNETSSAKLYAAPQSPSGFEQMRVWYRPEDMRASTMMQAMLKATNTPRHFDDFRLPVAPLWSAKLDGILRYRLSHLSPRQRARPLMVLRPLVMRTEWGGCAARNPDAAAYRRLFDSIRRHYTVISVADLVAGVEWLVDGPMGADVEFHTGELSIELLAALCRRAALVYCSPGFAMHLGIAVETSVACVFGGYERARMHADAAAWAPWLGIDTIAPCDCFSHHHACEKRIHLPTARRALQDFSDSAISAKRPE